MELRRVECTEIEKVIIHVLDKNGNEPILNSQELELTESVESFVRGHVEKLINDAKNIKAKFFNNRGVVYTVAESIINDEKGEAFIESSKKIADYIFRVSSQYADVPSSDLIVVKFRDEKNVPLVGILKLDYQKTVQHSVEFVQDEPQVDLAFTERTLPSIKQKVSCGAIIRLPEHSSDYDLVAIEKAYKDIEGGKIQFFVREILQANRFVDHIDKTKMFYKEIESFVNKNFRDDLSKATSIREDLEDIYQNNVELTITEMIGDIIDDEDKRNKFIETLEVAGFDTEEPFELDKVFLEKKLKSKQLKTDTGFTIRGVTDLFKDSSKYELKYNGDGSVNITIKNIRNMSKK